MLLKKLIYRFLIISSIISCACCNHNPILEISLPDKFEGQTVDLIDFLDSTLIASGVVKDGKVTISKTDTVPLFTSVIIDGRTRAFYILENGKALLNDSISSATGTPLNDEFSALLHQLDSIDSLDDTEIYTEFVRNSFNKYKDGPLSDYLGIEFVKYANLQQIDSIIMITPRLAESPKVQYYKNLAKLRDSTSAGKKYIDFEGETEKGKPTTLSSLVNEKGFTLIDFWASWCPYCIKEIPELEALKEKWGESILKIVGVAVRDIPEDTKAIVNKHNITWPVIYNAQRLPYDIYGFTGIPHHILLNANGIIVSRGESIKKIDSIIEDKLKHASFD